MQNPKKFVTNPSLVFWLKKSLYGIKQDPRAWYAKIDGFFLSLKYCRCNCNPNVYLNLIHGSLIILLLYVHALLITGGSKEEISSFKDAMNHAFSMTNLGLLSQFFGVDISQSDIGIKVHKSKYASYLLNNFRMNY